jgi:hypothetical protein
MGGWMVIPLLCSTSAIAGAGWTGSRTILGLETYSGGIEIRLDGFGGGCTGFTEGGVLKTWTKIETTQPNSQQLVATLLTAFAAGQPVNLHCGNNSDWTGLDRIVVAGL